MKLVTFTAGSAGQASLGAWDGADLVVDLQRAHQRVHGELNSAFSSMQALIDAGPSGLDLARSITGKDVVEATATLSEVRLLAPLPRPAQLRDCLCFEAHLTGTTLAAMRRNGLTEPTDRHKGMAAVFKQRPLYYKANRFSVVGPNTDVLWPAYSKDMDYELEMGCVLGRRGVNIPASEAARHIFGFTIFNDFSARDTQAFEMAGMVGPSKSKDFDNGNAMGPCIVTTDEFDPYDAAMIARVNGEVRSEGHSSSITVRFEDLISFISTSETLHPGEILGSGTVGGGCGLEQDRLLESGDEVELEIVGIGRLRNRVFSTAGR